MGDANGSDAFGTALKSRFGKPATYVETTL